MAAMDDATRDEVARDTLSMIGQLAAALGTSKELIDNLHGRLAALEVRQAADLRGRRVIRADDDSPCPHAGTILDRAGILGDEFAWVLWDSDRPDFAPAREALDELTPAP